MDSWNIQGTNTLRGSVYTVEGAGAGSPFPDEGDMFFDEFNIYFDKTNSAYSHTRGEISGLYNLNDDYRSPDFGVVPERISLIHESGEGSLPFRAEFGDHFAYYSYLTLQRSLKGFQLELQPLNKIFGYSQSLLISSGADQSNWRRLDLKDNYTNGLSWLMQNDNGGFSFNLVHNYRDGSVDFGTLDRNQFVASLSGEHYFSSSEYDMTLEGEIAHFIGDHNGVAGAASGQDRNGSGYFLQLSGRSKTMPWDYRLRFDNYDQDFQPTGAIVNPDRRSIEFHSGWLYDSGIRMRGRVQLFQDSVGTTNKLSTHTYGLNFSGPLLKWLADDIRGNMDAFLQTRNDELSTVDSFAENVNLSLTKPLPDDWLGRASLFWQNLDDESATDADQFIRQLNLNADHAFYIAGFEGVITPGIMLRTLRRGVSDSTDINPTLALNLIRGPHAIRADYGSLIQNRSLASGAIDTDIHTLNLDYRYSRKQHVFGLESNLFARDPEPGATTEAYRVSAFWTYQFDKPASSVAYNERSTTTGVAQSTGMVKSMADLKPGLNEQQVDVALESAGIVGGTLQSGLVVYETPLIRDLIRRQRLALEYETGLLERSALVVDFDDVGDAISVSQTFERVRQILIRQLGNPSRTFETGEFTASFMADINSQRLIRIIEWDTPDGKIRFGIPRRLDNQVRMEVQYARSFPQPRETLWSISRLR